eukprot:m.347767 g.347767  ORF g.347767 m.347767 type:complete len:104 (+) comp20672_c1_seq5:582-893(+)
MDATQVVPYDCVTTCMYLGMDTCRRSCQGVGRDTNPIRDVSTFSRCPIGVSTFMGCPSRVSKFADGGLGLEDLAKRIHRAAGGASANGIVGIVKVHANPGELF